MTDTTAGASATDAPAHNSSAGQWITMEQAAEMIQVDVKTIRRMISRGDIEARRFGPRLIRINPQSVLDYGTPLGTW